MRTTFRTLLLSALVALLAVPVGATEPDPPTLRTERTYFACGDVNKVRTVNGLQVAYDTWDLTVPTTSFTAGGGCGTTAAPIGDPELNGTWEGTFAGNLDRMAVEVHIIDVGLSRAEVDYALVPTLEIDNVPVPLDTGEFGFVEVETVRSDTNLTVRGRFTITGLNLKTEPGDGTTERKVRLSLSGTSADSGAFVWDATEVPSGITFNPEAVQGPTVRKG
jgi:hypothetical protein